MTAIYISTPYHRIRCRCHKRAGIGALESCKVSVDGSVTVRGTVPFDVAGDYINGKIAIFAIPSWADDKEYMAAAQPWQR